ncbi:hypothetical protein DFS33DRAFT_1290860 [Desarmillaria ectypa]|nr:hypothetical protein DFS33DRAFT_1290860 [Desarmillaria ectypa]
MSSLPLDQQLRAILLLVMLGVVVILRTIVHLLCRHHDNGLLNTVSQEANQDAGYEGCTFCLHSIQFIREPPTLPLPVTSPPTHTTQSIPDILHGVLRIFHDFTPWKHFIALFTGNTHSDNHTRRGVYSDSDAFTHHGLGDRNMNIINTPDPAVRTSDTDDGGTQGGRGESREGTRNGHGS